jgi:D-alanine-D-alanine ligase
VEGFLAGREFTVGVLGNSPPNVLGVMEIMPAHGVLEDFVYCVATKRECDKRVRYRCPPHIPEQLCKQIEKVALDVYAVLGCRDVARIDVRLDHCQTPHFLEANPLPGMAPGYSDLVILAREMGLSYEMLVEAILSHALVRCRFRIPSLLVQEPWAASSQSLRGGLAP